MKTDREADRETERKIDIKADKHGLHLRDSLSDDVAKQNFSH